MIAIGTSSGPHSRDFTAVWQEDGWYVAQCLEVDVASQGETEDEAVASLRAALHPHFAPLPAVQPVVGGLQ